MRTIGIDQSFTGTGLVILEDNKLIHTQVITSNDKESDEYRIIHILNEIFKNINKDDFIFLENIPYSVKGRGVRKLAGLYYAIMIKCKLEGYDYESFMPTTVKAFALKGNSKKEEMYELIPKEDKDIILKTDVFTKGGKKTKLTNNNGILDVSDAYWIAKLGFSQL